MTVALVKTIKDHDEIYQAILIWCPGCSETHEDGSLRGGLHMLPISGDSTKRPTWIWNGDLEKVLLSPSILSRHMDIVCHSFVQNGMWEFLSDSTHKLSGQKVPMVDLPDWLLA